MEIDEISRSPILREGGCPCCHGLRRSNGRWRNDRRAYVWTQVYAGRWHAQSMSPVVTGSGGAVRPWGQPPCLRARKRATRAEVPISEAFCDVLEWAIPLKVTFTCPSRIQGALITAITNPWQPCSIPPQGGASPRVTTDINLRWDQGSLITAITNPT